MNDDLIGATLGRCVIEDLLGQGGMARVYRAKQQHLDRYVAIKILPPYYAADPAFVDRFKLEARAMARLSHPHIVTVHDAGEENGRLYIVMEYVGGGTLKQRMAVPMQMREVARIIHEVASALTYANSMGIIHRDVKPVNVLMDTNGRAVLSDFGIAKVLATSAALTHTGAGVGTPEYMSPEQCRGVAVDARADIYALGVMLYEMLTGHTPFEADNYTALAHSHIYEPAPPPSRLNPRISPAVQAVIMKALEKDPAQRFQQATDMAVTLEQAVASQTPVGLAPGRHTVGPTPQAEYPPANAAGQGYNGGGASLCPNCHSPNAPQQRHCSTCGASLMFPQRQQTGQYPQMRPGLFTCVFCQAPNQPNNRFCTSCGQRLSQPYPCRICGMRNPPGTRFCTSCGHQLHQ